LTGVLRRLAAQRLLRRIEDVSDRRRVVLRLTRNGERVNTTIAGTVEESVGAVLRGVSDRERASARRILARLADQLAAVSRTTSPSSR
jgi:DNA-binding MarR family transcriptional regulator